MNRHLVAGSFVVIGLLGALAACGSNVDLGDRRSSDGGPTLDADLDGGVLADVADASDAPATDAPRGATCGRGTARPSCRVFITDARTQADFGGLGGADSRCAAAASGAGVSGTFKAFLSDGVIAAWSRFQSDGPWVLMGSNEPLFASAAALKVDGPHPLDRNERGESLSITGHWTGVREQGFGGAACDAFTSKEKTLRGSFGNTAPSRWLFQADVTCDVPVGFHLLCFED